MNVGALCSRRPVTVSAGTPLSTVVELMGRQHVGAVIVTADDRPRAAIVGIITDRDVMRAQLYRTADLSRLRTGDVMTADPLVLDELQPTDTAIAHLRARGVRRAPVVATDGSLVGLISVDDLLGHLARALMHVASLSCTYPVL